MRCSEFESTLISVTCTARLGSIEVHERGQRGTLAAAVRELNTNESTLAVAEVDNTLQRLYLGILPQPLS